MAVRPGKNLYLYLALACFLGIVLIFFFDGYVGVYDSLKADNGTYIQEVSAEQWQSTDRYAGPFSMSIDASGSLAFTYRVDNRRFTGYSAPVTVTLTDGTGQTTEVTRQTLTAGAFRSGEVSWTLRSADLPPVGATNGTVMVELTIQRGSVTRSLSLYVNRTSGILKGVPVPEG